MEAFNRTFQNFLTLEKDRQKDKYNLEESIYNNDREHSIINVTPFIAMMNVDNKDLINKIRENKIKSI